MVKLNLSSIGLLLLAFTMIVTAQNNIDLTDDERRFYMGFTPFPYEVSFDAVLWTYNTITKDADLIAHHFDNGVPWPEALADVPFSDHIMEDWDIRRSLTPAEHKVYVSITPIRLLRDGLALYRGDGDDLPLPAPWDMYTLDHPDVKTAFVNYARRIIAYFEPDFLNIGIEANGLISNRPDLWPAYVELHRYVYDALKLDYPDLPIFVSFVAGSLLNGFTDDDVDLHRRGLEDIIEYSDLFALSLYPYLSRYLTTPWPDDMIAQLRALSDKPMAIAETGYPAQTFDYVSDAGSLTFESDEQRQLNYMTYLLQNAQQHDFAFIIYFVLRDYDVLWEQVNRDALATLWRDTGLYAEDGIARPAWETWRQYLALPVVP